MTRRERRCLGRVIVACGLMLCALVFVLSGVREVGLTLAVGSVVLFLRNHVEYLAIERERGRECD